MLNKHSFRKSVFLFTTLVLVTGSITIAIPSLNISEANPNKWQDHKDMVSWFYMAMLDGSAMHKHAISNFSLSDISSQGNTTSYKGTVTITLKEGPVKEVPIEIKVMNNHVIAFSLDATKTKNHFGDTPIYGIIPARADVMKMKSHMGNKTMTETNMNMSQK